MSPRFLPRFVPPFSPVSFSPLFSGWLSRVSLRSSVFTFSLHIAARERETRGVNRFFIIFNCSVHYPMQIKIIRRLKDAFIFRFPMYPSISSSLFAPLCSSLLLSVAAFTRVTPFARRVSRSFLLPFSWYRVTGSPLFSFPSSTRILYLVLWWRVQRHYFNSLFSWFFPSYGDDDGVAVLFTLLPSPSAMHGAFSAAFTAAFLFQAFVTLKRDCSPVN